MFECVEPSNGKFFKVRPAWDTKKRSDMYADYVNGLSVDYYNKKATVEFRGRTKYGLPFHPVMISVRDYE